MAAKRKTTKKAAPRKRAKRVTKDTVAQSVTPSVNKISVGSKNKKYFIWLIASLSFILLLYLTKSIFVAAIVDGRPISRLSLVKELEKQGGKETLENLVTRELIFQEARKENVFIDDETVKTEIDKIAQSVESQGTTLDAALALQGQTRATLEENIRIQKTVEKLLEEDIQISDEDVSKYYEENKQFYGEDAKYEDLKEDITNQLKQEKLSAAFQEWIEKLKSDSKIIYFVNY